MTSRIAPFTVYCAMSAGLGRELASRARSGATTSLAGALGHVRASGASGRAFGRNHVAGSRRASSGALGGRSRTSTS